MYFCAHGSAFKRNTILEHQNEGIFYNNTWYVLEVWLLTSAVTGLNFSPLYQQLWGGGVQWGRQWGSPRARVFRVNCYLCVHQYRGKSKQVLKCNWNSKGSSSGLSRNQPFFVSCCPGHAALRCLESRTASEDPWLPAFASSFCPATGLWPWVGCFTFVSVMKCASDVCLFPCKVLPKL